MHGMSGEISMTQFRYERRRAAQHPSGSAGAVHPFVSGSARAAHHALKTQPIWSDMERICVSVSMSSVSVVQVQCVCVYVFVFQLRATKEGSFHRGKWCWSIAVVPPAHTLQPGPRIVGP